MKTGIKMETLKKVLELDEYELAKHFMDKIVALEEQSISECMETDLYESKLNDIIQEYKLYLKEDNLEEV